MGSACPRPVLSAVVVGPAEDLESMLPGNVPSLLDRAESPADAIVRLVIKPYDLVLVDHTAEGDVTEEHLAYVRAMQAIRPESKTIVLVSHTTTRKVIEALRHGMFAY